jgi:hypothetical protein
MYNTTFIQFLLIKYILNMWGKYNLEFSVIISNEMFSKELNVDYKLDFMNYYEKKRKI